MRSKGEKLPNPGKFYVELVAAKNRGSVKQSYENDKIIFTEEQFYSPNKVFISNWKNLFFESMKFIGNSHFDEQGRVKSALIELGCIDREFLDSQLKYDPEALIIARKHRSGFRFGIISNDISEWSSYLRKKYSINDTVEIAVISGDAGMRKPGKEIFYHFLKLAKAIPENCIFIDDNINNLITARQIGIKSVLLDRDRNFSGNENNVDYAIGSWEELDDILNDISLKA